MSDETSTQDETLFWNLVDDLIERANESAADADMGIVNAAMMEACARFNAYYVALSSESKADLKEDKEDAVKRFGGEYKSRLASNINDYIDNFKVYLKADQ